MVNSSPAVAAHAEGEEIEVLESTDVLPVAPEDSLLLALHLPNPDPPHILPRDKDCDMKDEGGPNAEEERDRYQYEGKEILGLRGWQT
ncbi:hypothetical protein DPX16_20210 [Anabarilius grahami]|uniref:Uncharacterized protein n=1 Tax=Anabarilius grahami TaxID=495550 RepID=A0A3N0XE58_ANAGA|nr:hypothetical protein DPX16_20210 [Anabarilius grahami]